MIEFSLNKTLHTAEGEMQLNVSARIESGKFVSLYGASGSGKTSLLRMLAGFMKPENGYIKVNDAVWFDRAKKINTEPRHRKIGFVFQDYALFPNMNVRENISFALKKNESTEIVDELLELSGLSNLANRKIQALSGGQQQRVALARAIVKKPSVLLLDEPLSAVDSGMRAQLQGTLAEMHKRFGLTTILVSHNSDEILRLSDTVFHLANGKFQQQAAPATFFLHSFTPGTLTGTIVAFEDNGNAVVLIDDRMIRIAPSIKKLKINDKVEIICDPATVSILKT